MPLTMVGMRWPDQQLNHALRVRSVAQCTALFKLAPSMAGRRGIGDVQVGGAAMRPVTVCCKRRSGPVILRSSLGRIPVYKTIRMVMRGLAAGTATAD